MTAAPRRAFTLVELLVVIAIIILLLATLAPSLARTRQQAKAATCTSNQHQVGQAWAAFAAQNKGLYVQAPVWTAALVPCLGKKNVLICTEDASPALGAIDAAAVRVSSGGTFLYDMPLTSDTLTRMISQEQFNAWSATGFAGAPPGQYVPGSNPNVFYYCFEDIRPGGGDLDFNDVVLRVEEKEDGVVEISTGFHSAGYSFQFIGDGAVLTGDLKGNYGKIPIKGYRCSYGMNVQARAAAMNGKTRAILTLDYARTIADCGGTNSTDSWPGWTIDGKLIFARHQGGMNVLFTDGGVRRKVRVEVDPDIREIRESLWLP